MQILQKLIDLASFEKEEAIYTISCFDMHKRNREITDNYLEAYSYGIFNSELVIAELENYQKVIKDIRYNLELEFNNEFNIESEEEVLYTDVYKYLLDFYFSEYSMWIPNEPTQRTIDLIDFYYGKKKIYAEGLAKFFTIVKKKVVQDEEGNNVLVDWTEKDELDKLSSEDLAKIELIQEWESFIDTMRKVKEMLENKEDVLKILKLIK